MHIDHYPLIMSHGSLDTQYNYVTYFKTCHKSQKWQKYQNYKEENQTILHKIFK